MHKNYTLIICAALALTACGPSEAERRHAAAVALDAQIDSALAAGDNQLALDLIDTLNTRFNTELDLRRASDTKRAQAIAGLSMSRIPAVELQIIELQARVDSLSTLFTSVRPTPSMPPVLMHKGVSTSLMARACVQPRVNEGQDALDLPYTLAVNAGRDINITSLTISTRNGRTFVMPALSSDGITATVTPESVDELASYLIDNKSDDAIGAVATGSKGTVKIAITPAESRAIADAALLASTRQQLRSAQVTSDKLNALVQAARDRQARTANP